MSGSNSYSTICSSPPPCARLGRVLIDVSYAIADLNTLNTLEPSTSGRWWGAGAMLYTLPYHRLLPETHRYIFGRYMCLAIQYETGNPQVMDQGTKNASCEAFLQEASPVKRHSTTKSCLSPTICKPNRTSHQQALQQYSHFHYDIDLCKPSCFQITKRCHRVHTSCRIEEQHVRPVNYLKT